MDKLRALQYLAAAAAEKSFSGAARTLDVSVPAVAKMINALEKQLGVQLFERTPRGLTLTAGGASYLEACAPAMAQLTDADEQARALAVRLKGTLVVGVQHVIARGCLTAALPRFHARHPDIELDVRDFQQVTESNVSGVDVMLILGWPTAPDLVCRFIVVASPAYWAAHRMPQRPKDLEQHVCLTIRGVAGAVMDVWGFARGEEQETALARGWLTTSNAHRDLVIELGLEGHGVMRILDWTNLPHLASGVLVPALTDWESTEAVPVNLLYSASARRIPRARVFIDFVTELFGDLDRTRGGHVVGTERPAWLSRPHARASDFVVRPGRPR
jgi:LysR family transcriptional regulator for bpeEF and oprC